jgi:hypothetical protein
MENQEEEEDDSQGAGANREKHPRRFFGAANPQMAPRQPPNAHLSMYYYRIATGVAANHPS